MTKDQIYNECTKIAGELSPTAYEAYYLASKCLSARNRWHKNIDNMSAQNEYGNAASKLESYCQSNKQIRSEAFVALEKIKKLISDDARDQRNPKSPSKQRDAEIKREIAALQSSKKDRTSKILTIIMIISAVLFTGCLALNFITGDYMMFSAIQFELGAAFIVPLIITLVRNKKRKDKIDALMSEMGRNQKDQKWHDSARIADATRAKECYELIIRGVGNGSLADFR